MGHLLEIILHLLGYLLSWRAWLCLILGVVVGFALLKYGVAFIWRGDIVLIIGVLGLALGLVWAAGAKDNSN